MLTSIICSYIKGVCHAEGKRLTLDHFVNSLNNGSEFLTTLRGFKQNSRNQMKYYEMTKSGLNPVFIKFEVDDDLISCKPLKINNEYM